MEFYNLRLAKANFAKVEPLAGIFLIPIQKFPRIVDLDSNMVNWVVLPKNI